MDNIFAASMDDLDVLHHLPMTILEEQLKRCALRRPELKHRVLSAAEMSDYIIWLVETFGADVGSILLPKDIPPMLTGGDVAKLGYHIMQNPGDKKALEELTALYETPMESHFFQESQDISTNRFLRYLPAYWRVDHYFEVYYAFSGQCPVMFEHETVMMEPGTVLIIPPSIMKACTCPSDDCVVHFYMIRSSTFSQVFLNSLSDHNLMSLFFRQALSEHSNTAYLRFDTGQDSSIESLLHYIYCEYISDGSYSSQMLNSLMSTFLLLLLQRYENTAQISKKSNFHWKPEFAAMFNYIQTHYQSVTLEKLSQKYNYSERQIIRIIQNCTGKKFSGFMLQLRMEKAARMLFAQTASINTIAAEVGYSTLSSFYRAFTQYYGCTPRAYLQSQQEQLK